MHIIFPNMPLQVYIYLFIHLHVQCTACILERIHITRNNLTSYAQAFSER